MLLQQQSLGIKTFPKFQSGSEEGRKISCYDSPVTLNGLFKKNMSPVLHPATTLIMNFRSQKGRFWSEFPTFLSIRWQLAEICQIQIQLRLQQVTEGSCYRSSLMGNLKCKNSKLQENDFGDDMHYSHQCSQLDGNHR